MKTLKEILGSKSRTEFEFIDVLKEQSQRDGSPILVFVLKTQIPKVTGRTITDQDTNDSVRLEAFDVEEIRVGKETIDELYKLDEEAVAAGKQGPIQWTVEGKEGKIVCDIALDVSNAQQVWLTKTPFGQFGREQRQQRAKAQRSNLVAKMQERKAQASLKGADVNATGGGDKKPEAVETTGSADDNGKAASEAGKNQQKKAEGATK